MSPRLRRATRTATRTGLVVRTATAAAVLTAALTACSGGSIAGAGAPGGTAASPHAGTSSGAADGLYALPGNLCNLFATTTIARTEIADGFQVTGHNSGEAAVPPAEHAREADCQLVSPGGDPADPLYTFDVIVWPSAALAAKHDGESIGPTPEGWDAGSEAGGAVCWVRKKNLQFNVNDNRQQPAACASAAEILDLIAHGGPSSGVPTDPVPTSPGPTSPAGSSSSAGGGVDQGAPVADVASAYAEEMFGYDYRTVDAQLRAATAHMTAAYAAQWTKNITAIVPAIKSEKARVTVTVSSAATSASSPTGATVELVITQYTTNAATPTPRMSKSAVRMTLVRENGTWLVSGVAAH